MLNLGLEGMMLLGAYIGFIAAYYVPLCDGSASSPGWPAA